MYVQHVEVIAEKEKDKKKLALTEVILLLSLRFLYGTSETTSKVSTVQHPLCVLATSFLVLCCSLLKCSPSRKPTFSLPYVSSSDFMIPRRPPLSEQLHLLSFVAREETRGASVLFARVYAVWQHHEAWTLTSVTLTRNSYGSHGAQETKWESLTVMRGERGSRCLTE